METQPLYALLPHLCPTIHLGLTFFVMALNDISYGNGGIVIIKIETNLSTRLHIDSGLTSERDNLSFIVHQIKSNKPDVFVLW